MYQNTCQSTICCGVVDRCKSKCHCDFVLVCWPTIPKIADGWHFISLRLKHDTTNSCGDHGSHSKESSHLRR